MSTILNRKSADVMFTDIANKLNRKDRQLYLIVPGQNKL